MAYVDGFVLAVPKKNLKTYVAIARRAGKVWREYGCLEYRECVGDDIDVKGMLGFTKLARLKRGETAVFSWITYRSKAHRDAVNRKIMKDPRLAAMMKDPPFDMKRMAYGGFRVVVDNP